MPPLWLGVALSRLRRVRVRRLIACATIAMMTTCVVGLTAIVYHVYSLPLPATYENPGRGATILKTATGEVFASRGTARGGHIERGDLPEHLVDAVLATEDRRFYEHGGLDLRGIFRAATANLFAGGISQGGSTITQQLVKNLFLTPERTFSRKFQEAILALWLERRLTKDRILERYLDTVYLGAGAYGLDAAARRYFGKTPRNLTLAEAAMLVGLIHAPSRLAPTRSLDMARARADTVLAAMVETGAITGADAAKARAEPARLAVPPRDTPGNGHFADWVDAEAQRLLGGVIGDFSVETTLVPALQAEAERVVARWLDSPDAKGVSEAALVAMAPDGAVLALVGGRDYVGSQFNRAAQARRQPGSLFKLFVYLAALQSGMTPDSPVVDAPVRIGDWEPGNFGDRYHGKTTLRTAFAESLNSVAVRVAEEVGRDKVIALARSMGIESPLVPDPSLALGTSEVTLLEITAAFAAVDAGVSHVQPYGVRRIGSPGIAFQVRETPPPAPPTWPREMMLDLLASVVRSGTGKAAALDMPTFGKTGTTQESRDAWFVGFTRDLVVGVWVGNDDNAPMNGMTGGRLPARIWADFVRAAQQGSRLAQAAAAEPQPAPEPAGQVALPPQVIRPPAPVVEPEPLDGVPAVIDTGTLRLGGRIVRLEGVRGEGGRLAREMARYIGGREVVCEPTGADRFRCEVDGWDLSEAVLFNGGGRATPDARPDLRSAESRARALRQGLWAGR
jgi:penicillin-binding protein 1A